eukprot:c25061_g1_i2 orf=133-420(+)
MGRGEPAEIRDQTSETRRRLNVQKKLKHTRGTKGRFKGLKGEPGVWSLVNTVFYAKSLHALDLSRTKRWSGELKGCLLKLESHVSSCRIKVPTSK